MTSILADNLKRLCATYGLSHNDLAKKSGVRQSVISRIIKGVSVPREGTIRAIANALNVDPWQLRTSIYAVDKETGLIKGQPQTAPDATPRPLKDTFCALGEPLVFKSPFPNTVGADALLDDEKRAVTWRNALRVASEGEGEALLTMTMPTDDLAPVIPRGAILYLAVETDPSHPTLPEDTPVVGVLPLGNGEQTLVFGYPSVSLGRVSLKTANGNSVAVDKVIAYIKGWTVFKFLSRVSYRTAS